MRALHHSIAGRPVRINVVEDEDDVPAFKEFVRRNKVLSYDTEGTGLNVFSPTYRLRLVQLGAGAESWVLPVEKGPRYEWLARTALEHAEQLVCHNAAYDLLAADQRLGVPLERLFPKVVDTSILSRLVDSRAAHEGGTGHSLEDLTAAYIDKEIAEEVKGSIRVMAKDLKVTKREFFATVPIDHKGYLLYAGMDPMLTWALWRILAPRVPASARGLVPYEHEIARICAQMERRGFLLDRPYTEALIDRLEQEETHWVIQAEAELLDHTVYEGETFYDLDEVEWGSTQQMALAFMDRGIVDFEFTAPTKAYPDGQIKLDEKFLKNLAEQGDLLAEAIREAKKASKWRKTWPEAFLREADGYSRVHPSINTLQARTARMSITGIPAQTLPSGDSMVRNCFLADEGHVIVSVDYANQELRVAAALSGDARMRTAFIEGDDLHQLTADGAGVDRKIGKMANFLVCYGGGWKALMEQGGVDQKTAKRTIDGFNRTYPGIKKLSEDMETEAKRQGFIETFTGRRLYVDRGRGYSAINYAIQSGSRDITARGLLECDRQGLGEYLRLPVHDEVVGSAPEKEAKEIAGAIGRAMATSLKGVELPTDPEVGGRSWGSLYED